MMTFLAILLIFMTLSVHEMGHAWAMRERGVPIKRISLLGVPFSSIGIPWPRTMWRLPIVSKWFPGTEWVVHPLIIGAYVETEEDVMENLSSRDTTYIASMGPIASILIGIALFGFGITSLYIDHAGITEHAALIAYTTLILMMAMWILRDWIARFVCLLAGVLLIAVIIWSVAKFGLVQSLVGPVGLVDLVHTQTSTATERYQQFVVAGVEHFALWNAFQMAGIVSIAIGATNLLPIWPLDGGLIASAHMPERWRARFTDLSRWGLRGLIALALLSDGIRVVNSLS